MWPFNSKQNLLTSLNLGPDGLMGDDMVTMMRVLTRCAQRDGGEPRTNRSEGERGPSMKITNIHTHKVNCR